MRIKILAISCLLPACSAFAAEPKPLTIASIDQRTVTVDAIAIVKAKPDRIEWLLEIDTIQPTVEEGRNAVDNSLERLQAGLKKLGIKESALVISDLNQDRRYTWKRDSREFEGYHTALTLRLSTNDFSLISKINFLILSDNLIEVKWLARRTDREGELRQKALADAALVARKKAEILANTLGAKVGDILRIEEKSFETPFRSPGFIEGNSVNSVRQNSPGEQEEGASQILEISIRASVNATFELVK